MVTMSSSRRGGTKLLNCKGASGRETHAMGACLISQEKGDARHGGASRTSGTRVSFFYLTCTKRISINYSPRVAPCANK
jgi:hypothetical protein